MGRKRGRKRSRSKGKSHTRKHRTKRTRKTSKKRVDRRNVYLGKVVPDTGRPGLDSLKEVEGICKAIIRDYKAGKIDKKTANGRFFLLYYVIIPKDHKLTGKKRKAKEITKKYWDKLKKM